MHLSYDICLVFLILGLFVGLMAGLLGIGGGGILVPVLTSIFLYMNIPQQQVLHLALGTSMACIIITSVSSLLAHRKTGNVNWTIVRKMVPMMLIGTFLSTFLATSISPKPLAIFFSCFMAYVSLQMFFNISPPNSQAEPSNIELGCVATFIGMISALVSIGGGSLTVPYLNWRNTPIKVAIGTSAALGLPIALAGSFGYLINGLSASIQMPYAIGFVFLPAAICIAIPSYFTAPYGARLAQKLPVKTIKKIFGLMLMLLSLKMVSSFM